MAPNSGSQSRLQRTDDWNELLRHSRSTRAFSSSSNTRREGPTFEHAATTAARLQAKPDTAARRASCGFRPACSTSLKFDHVSKFCAPGGNNRLSAVDAGLIGTVTLLTSAFGGWAAGILADRFGRVRTPQISTSRFAVFTFLCGFSQTYNQLLISRALMGFGFGGEWAAGAVLMGEVIRARHRGKAVSFVQSGWSIRLGRSCSTLDLAFHRVSARYRLADSVLGWLGPSIHCLFLRRFVEDQPVFKAAREKIAAGGLRQRPFEIFSPELIRTTILTCLLATGAQGGY